MLNRKHGSSSSVKILKSFKSFLFNKGKENVLHQRKSSINNRNQEIYTSVAVTLTTELSKHDYEAVTILQLNHSTFLPSQPVSIRFDQEAFVHYEPRESQVVFGSNPDASHSKTLKLTVQQFAWLIQQLNEENYTQDSLQTLYTESSLNIRPSMLGVLNTIRPRSLKRRFLHFVQRKRGVSQSKIHRQCMLLLPKTLLMQAALHIPTTKPLPPLPVPSSSSYAPYELISTPYLTRLKRYCRYVALCSHELLMSGVPPERNTVPIRCTECSLQSELEYIPKAEQAEPFSYQDKTVMFPVSYVDYKQSIASLDSPHASSAFEYMPDEQRSDASTESLSSPQKYGYAAVNHSTQEIIVVFPGMATSRHMINNVSFGVVSWLEPDTASVTNKELDQSEAWVLECAHTAWRRCEMKVVTLLMRLCAVMPSHYKVVIIGHSLGGAVACLCASSLRTTKLLLNRPITVCTLFSPRVGNKAFIHTLAMQDVHVVRITDPADIMAHLPPRTSGLLHAGDSAVIVTGEMEDACVIENAQPELIEDTLNKIPLTKDDMEIERESTLWGIELDNDGVKCISDLL